VLPDRPPGPSVLTFADCTHRLITLDRSARTGIRQMSAQKDRFRTPQSHLDQGLKIRGQRQLGDALLEFQKAYALNPGSSAAEQEIHRTQKMIQHERLRLKQTVKEAPPRSGR
jgi:hypothetical protein